MTKSLDPDKSLAKLSLVDPFFSEVLSAKQVKSSGTNDVLNPRGCRNP
jgi:hypothetical protein